MTLDDVLIRTWSNIFRGSMLFTHEGITGPVVFDMDIQEDEDFPAEISLDLVPSRTSGEIEDMITRSKETEPKKKLRNILSRLVARRMAERVLLAAGISEDLNSNQLRRDMRRNLISAMKDLKITCTGADNRLAMITAGGIDVSEVEPSTLESRIVKGLFFAGEILDVHARTGGFNLQVAFSTGYLAGDSC
jgi:predicted Rossmann fold flavoprotein